MIKLMKNLKLFLCLLCACTVGGVNSVKAQTPSKKELTPTGSTFVTQTYKKFHVNGVGGTAFNISSFDMTGWDHFYINIAVPTTVGDWLFMKAAYAYGDGYQVVSTGTSGKVELTDTKLKGYSTLVLQAGDPAGARDIVLKDVYYLKEEGNVKNSILPTLGGEDYEVEEATAAGVKAFDMTNVDVSGYDKLVVSFTSPTIGEWVLNIDGTNETIPAGTHYYRVDVSGKTTLGTLALSVGNDELPRVNNFDKLYLSKPESISSDADWTSFATRVNGGETDLDAVLTADVDAGSTMVGTATNPYQGTFDGAGHTLTFTYDGESNLVAPFKEVNGASFVDLKTTGSITSTANLLGGIVGQVNGATTLTRCASDMSITTTVNDNGRIGGLVARNGQTGSSLTFNNCMYNGAISSSTNQAAGFVGWSPNATTISNCLVAASSITGGESNFAPNNITVPDGKYALYISKFGSSTQGTAVTDAQRYSGYVAYTLNQGIGSGALFFGQGKLNSSVVEATPTLTSVASKKVIRTYKGETDFYSNPGGLLPDPALAGMLAWKFGMSGEAAYQTHLPAEQTTDREIYGTPDAYILVIGSAEASTFVFPFTTDGLPNGVKAYDLTFDGSVINATEVNKITADKPVLINAEAGTYKFESKLNWWESVKFSDHTETTNGALTGVYNTSLPFSYVPANAYVLQNGADGLGFYKVEADNTTKITSFRAYLTAPELSGDYARLSINFNNESTGIKTINGQLNTGNDVYDLQGRRIAQPTKGLYIVNGNKVIFK